MKLIRKLAAVIAEDASLPAGVGRSLVEGLYTPFGSLVVGAISGSIIAIATAWISADPEIAIAATAISVIGAVRVWLARVYLRGRPHDVRNIRAWERCYALGAYGFAASLGLLAFLAINRSISFDLQLITATTAIGYAAGISGRNAGRPTIAISQLLLASLPVAAGLLLSGDAAHACLGAVIILFTYGMIDITLSIRDIIVTALVTTREKEALAEQFRAQANLFDIALNNMSHGLCMFDARGRLKVWNERFSDISGIPAENLIVDTSARKLFHRSLAGIDFSLVRFVAGRDTFEQAMEILRTETLLVSLPGDRTVSMMQRRTADDGSVIIFEDITERRRDEARMQKMARYDDLTGLLNRSSFRMQVEQSLAKSGETGSPFAVHLLDLDRFKAVNDTMGHPAGDRLLQLVADRLRIVAQGSNSVARLGGDEFVILQFVDANPAGVSALAASILQALEEAFEIEGQRISIGASIGIALAPDHAEDGSRLLKCADIALYAVKADGRNGYRVFREEMEVETRARQAVEADLRTALTENQFEVYYQPLVDLKTQAIVSCEALLRWKHPKLGYIPPSEFIPVAEETGLILQIGEWVLNEACQEALRWPRNVSVAVNLSPLQFNDPLLSYKIAMALERSGLPALRLELEVTESVTLGGSDTIIETLQQLRLLGIRLSLDDFGTGYSSLSYLRKYEFDKIKIDRSFVKDLSPAAESVAIIRAIVGMGKSLGMVIVVEGIETDAQLAILRSEGCELGQGYLFSRPVHASALRSMFAVPLRAVI